MGSGRFLLLFVLLCFLKSRVEGQEKTFIPCNKIVVKSTQTVGNTSSSLTTFAEGSECVQSVWREVEQRGWEMTCNVAYICLTKSQPCQGINGQTNRVSVLNLEVEPKVCAGAAL